MRKERERRASSGDDAAAAAGRRWTSMQAARRVVSHRTSIVVFLLFSSLRSRLSSCSSTSGVQPPGLAAPPGAGMGAGGRCRALPASPLPAGECNWMLGAWWGCWGRQGRPASAASLEHFKSRARQPGGGSAASSRSSQSWERGARGQAAPEACAGLQSRFSGRRTCFRACRLLAQSRCLPCCWIWRRQANRRAQGPARNPPAPLALVERDERADLIGQCCFCTSR